MTAHFIEIDCRRFDLTVSAAAQARAALRQLDADLGSTIEVAALAASEIVSALYASSDAETLEMRAFASDESVRIQIDGFVSVDRLLDTRPDLSLMVKVLNGATARWGWDLDGGRIWCDIDRRPQTTSTV